GKENHFPALWTRRRQTEDARRSGQEVRRHARADSSVAKYRAVEVAPRAQQEGAPGRRRVAGGSLSWIDILALERGHEVRAFVVISPHAVGSNRSMRVPSAHH